MNLQSFKLALRGMMARKKHKGPPMFGINKAGRTKRSALFSRGLPETEIALHSYKKYESVKIYPQNDRVGTPPTHIKARCHLNVSFFLVMLEK